MRVTPDTVWRALQIKSSMKQQYSYDCIQNPLLYLIDFEGWIALQLHNAKEELQDARNELQEIREAQERSRGA